MNGKILKTPEAIHAFFARLESRMPGEDEAIVARVRNIIQEVREQGLQGVLSCRQRFEEVDPAEPLHVLRGSAELQNLLERKEECEEDVLEALELAIARVRAYHGIQVEHDRTFFEPGEKGSFTSRVQPLDSVAVYVPGGAAFYPSSVIMSVVPAQVAGVRRIAVVTPARSLQNAALTATLDALGIDEVIATGGAQGVAAAAFGFVGCERFDKIVGPGNVYVATAKHLLSGRIGIDSFAGPSEILVLSDASSPLEWIVTDLLSQAEHDPQASSVLVTTSEEEAKDVLSVMDGAIASLGDRAPIARASWEAFGAIICVEDRRGLLEIANSLHAEHLHVHTACALTDEGRQWWHRELRGVGAVFLGRHTAEVFGDYLAGPSHVLPTAGTARFSSPLGVYDFVRRSSVLWMTEELSADLARPTATLAQVEQLWAHERSARLRASKQAGGK